MLFQIKPGDYNPRCSIAICVISCDEEILLLRRQDHKHKGGMWDTPGGKIGDGEDLRAAMAREILEETQIVVSPEALKFVQEVYVRYPEFDFTSNLFYCKVKEKPEVKINYKEHSEFGWFAVEEALKMELVPDEAERIEICLAAAPE